MEWEKEFQEENVAWSWGKIYSFMTPQIKIENTSKFFIEKEIWILLSERIIIKWYLNGVLSSVTRKRKNIDGFLYLYFSRRTISCLLIYLFSFFISFLYLKLNSDTMWPVHYYFIAFHYSLFHRKSQFVKWTFNINN